MTETTTDAKPDTTVSPEIARRLVDALTATAAEIDRDPLKPLAVLVGRIAGGVISGAGGENTFFILWSPGCWPGGAGKYISNAHGHKYNEAPTSLVYVAGHLSRALDGLEPGDVVAVLATRTPDFREEAVARRLDALAVAREEAPPHDWRDVGGAAVLSNPGQTAPSVDVLIPAAEAA